MEVETANARVQYERKCLLSDIERSVKNLVDYATAHKDSPVMDDSEPLNDFLCVSCNVFRHGFKAQTEGIFSQSIQFDKVVQGLSKISPKVQTAIDCVWDLTEVTTSAGRVIAFIKYALIERKLDEYLLPLIQAPHYTKYFYEKDAFLCTHDMAVKYVSFAVFLKDIDFSLFLKDADSLVNSDKARVVRRLGYPPGDRRSIHARCSWCFAPTDHKLADDTVTPNIYRCGSCQRPTLFCQEDCGNMARGVVGSAIKCATCRGYLRDWPPQTRQATTTMTATTGQAAAEEKPKAAATTTKKKKMRRSSSSSRLPSVKSPGEEDMDDEGEVSVRNASPRNSIVFLDEPSDSAGSAPLSSSLPSSSSSPAAAAAAAAVASVPRSRLSNVVSSEEEIQEPAITESSSTTLAASSSHDHRDGPASRSNAANGDIATGSRISKMPLPIEVKSNGSSSLRKDAEDVEGRTGRGKSSSQGRLSRSLNTDSALQKSHKPNGLHRADAAEPAGSVSPKNEENKETEKDMEKEDEKEEDESLDTDTYGAMYQRYVVAASKSGEISLSQSPLITPRSSSAAAKPTIAAATSPEGSASAQLDDATNSASDSDGGERRPKEASSPYPIPSRGVSAERLSMGLSPVRNIEDYFSIGSDDDPATAFLKQKLINRLKSKRQGQGDVSDDDYDVIKYAVLSGNQSVIGTPERKDESHGESTPANAAVGGGGGDASASHSPRSRGTSQPQLPPPVTEADVTRRHWMRDEDAVRCAIAQCPVEFYFLQRRHHCRRCGDVVCADHIKKHLKLNRDAIPDPAGVECKVCDECYQNYQTEIVTSDPKNASVPSSPSSRRGSIDQSRNPLAASNGEEEEDQYNVAALPIAVQALNVRSKEGGTQYRHNQITLEIYERPKVTPKVCAGCSDPLPAGFLTSGRWCEACGQYFCSKCHSKKQSIIPARVLRNWDFTTYDVCDKSFEFLKSVYHDQLYDMDAVNPELYNSIKPLRTMMGLREQLRHLKVFLLTCTNTKKGAVRSYVKTLEKFDPDRFAMRELVEINEGTEVDYITALNKELIRHVLECELCSVKGYICEICRDPKPFFSFQTSVAVQCPDCKSFFHKECYSLAPSCPKCVRKRRYSSAAAASATAP